MRRTGGYNYSTYLPASPLLTMLSSLKRFPSQSKVLCPERSLLPTFPYYVGIKRAMRRRTRGLPAPLSGAALASWLVPSSAFLLKRRGHSLKSPTSAQAALSRRLPRMSSRLHSLSGCRVGAFACASLARGEKPAGSPQAGEHRGVRLSQPAMLILRHQRCSDPRPRRRWQAWSCRADPDLSLSGLLHHVQCSAPYPSLPFENPFTPDRSCADSAGRRTRPFRGGTGLRLSTSHDHDLALARWRACSDIAQALFLQPPAPAPAVGRTANHAALRQTDPLAVAGHRSLHETSSCA